MALAADKLENIETLSIKARVPIVLPQAIVGVGLAATIGWAGCLVWLCLNFLGVI